MTSELDLKKLVNPLLEKDEDLHYVSRVLIVGPVQHFISFIDFGTSKRSRTLQIYLHLVPLCEGTVGTPASGKLNRRYVSIDEAGYPDALRDEIRNDYIPFLKKNFTFGACMKVYDEFYPHYATLLNRCLISVLAGDFAGAANMINYDPPLPHIADFFNRRVDGLGDALGRKGDKLAIRDKRRLLAMLQRQEAAAAKALKLDKKLWEPSPFPAEIKYPELRVLSRDGMIAEE